MPNISATFRRSFARPPKIFREDMKGTAAVVDVNRSPFTDRDLPSLDLFQFSTSSFLFTWSRSIFRFG